MSEIDPTLNGNLEWEILARSFATDLDMQAIQRDILATREEWSEDDSNIVTEVAILLSGTRSLKIVGKKKTSQLVEMAAGINKRLPIDEIFAWRQRIPHKLTTAWNAAWLAGQDIFEVDSAQLPTDSLSDDEKEQLKDKTSFLAATG